MMNTLAAIAGRKSRSGRPGRKNRSHKSFIAHRGEVSGKWQCYIPVYEAIFAEYHDKRVSLLEIGVQNGGSLGVHAEYFSDAAIFVGNDINPRCRLLNHPPSIRVAVESCVDEHTKEQITAISPSFDIVIDGGSHKSKDTILAFLKYFPIVSAGGVYIIEDLHAGYWQQYGGGLFHKKSPVAFLKLLVDALNAEHGGVNQSIADFMTMELPEYRSLYDQNLPAEIKSITFSKSMCIIRKTDPGKPNKQRRSAPAQAMVASLIRWSLSSSTNGAVSFFPPSL